MTAATAQSALDFVRKADFDGTTTGFLRPQHRALLASKFGQTQLALLAEAPSPAPVGQASPSPATTSAADVTAAIGLQGNIKQAFVSGSSVISFDEAVTADLRAAAITGTLFCQLVADKAFPNHNLADWAANWYSVYRQTFTRLGWLVQDEQTVESGQFQAEASVAQALITLVQNVIGANGTSAIKAALSSISSLGQNNPVITLFKSQTENYTIDEASASIVSNTSDGFFVDLVEFAFDATGEDYQLLFFEWKNTSVKYNYRRLRLSLDMAIWNMIKDAVAAKLAGKLGLVNALPDVG